MTNSETTIVREVCQVLLIWAVFVGLPHPVHGQAEATTPFVAVLGVAQDAGYPQAGCRKACCRSAWADPALGRHVACLAIVDPQSRQRWLIDCTPDFREQLRLLQQMAPAESVPGLDGVLLTHAHIGHYTGLMQLGREVIGARQVPVYAMPRMRWFLENNGPWDQLVKLRQIDVRRMAAGDPLRLNERIVVTPFLVPHRDEYSETVGFLIRGPSRTVAYIPDIDKWHRWPVPVETILAKADTAYLDGTFFANGELPNRDISEIPHPFVQESIERFRRLTVEQRNKVRFIHLNHTNPLLNPSSPAARAVRQAGHFVASQGERQQL